MTREFKTQEELDKLVKDEGINQLEGLLEAVKKGSVILETIELDNLLEKTSGRLGMVLPVDTGRRSITMIYTVKKGR